MGKGRGYILFGVVFGFLTLMQGWNEDAAPARRKGFAVARDLSIGQPHKHLDSTLYARVEDSDKHSSVAAQVRDQPLPPGYQRFEPHILGDNHVDLKRIDWYRHLPRISVNDNHLPRISVADNPFHFEGVRG